MSMLHSVPRPEWRGFFDRVSGALLGKWAEIEVASLDLGDQIVVEWVPMLGITYDARDHGGGVTRRARECRSRRRGRCAAGRQAQRPVEASARLGRSRIIRH